MTTRPTPVGVVDQVAGVRRGQRERFVHHDVQARGPAPRAPARAWVARRCGDRHALDAQCRQVRQRGQPGVAPGSSARTCACRSGEPVTTATSSNPVAERDQRSMEGAAARAVPGQRPAKRSAPRSCRSIRAILCVGPIAIGRRMWGCRTPRLAWCSVIDHLIVRGAREHNLRNVDITLPRDSLVVFTGLSGFRQVVAGVRHHLRRGPAAVRRVAVLLCPAVPRPDGQAGRRLHRGPVAGGVDRPEVDVAQPAVDGRHHHRDLRLPAAAVRADRPPALPDLRRTDLQADPAADRRPGAGDARGHPVPGAGAGDPGAQGRVRRPVRRPAGQGLLAGPDRRGGPPADRAAEAEEAGEALHRGGRRPAGQPADRQAADHRLGGDRPAAWPTASSSSSSSTWTRTTRTANAATPSGWPARTTTRWPSTSSSRGRSRSTRRSAPAPSAPGSAPARRSTPSWWCPTERPPSAEGAIHPWAGGHHQRVLRAGCCRAWPR